MKNNSLLIIFISLLILGCGHPSIYVQNEQEREPKNFFKPNSPIIQEVYLIGDVGDIPLNSKAALQLLKKELDASEQDKTSVIFLGDNIYPKGLHEKEHPLRQQDERNINAQLDIVKDFKGEVVFIPGNHDWGQGGEDGFEMNKRQEDYIQDYLNRKVYEPSDGCAGPEEVEVSDELTFIIIDTQWWLHKYEKGRGEKDDCDVSTKEGFMLAFKELLKKNRNKHVIVAAHHPMYSNGKHGGYFGWDDRIFPLRNFGNRYSLPLPIIGSIYPFYRSFFGNIQDISNSKYQDMKRQLTTAMAQYDNVIYACGHEHNLQYFFNKNAHYVVSGSGAKLSGLRFNSKLDFGAEHRGFAKIEIHESGETVLKYFAADLSESENPVIFQKKLYQKNIKGFRELSDSEKKSYKGLYKEVIPDSTFHASELKQLFFGKLNRDLWTQPIQVPVLDIHYINGGLQPIEKGGGQQTVSLKLIGGDGKEYKLRGIKKSAHFLVQRELRGTIAQDIVYDGISGSHPYASVTIPKLLKAAELYYIQPKLVYVPKDPILGDYLEEFGGIFAVLEVHPDDDMSDMENFGNSPEIVNSGDAIEELQQHQNHVVDLEFTLRNRLLDMLIGDWDRHDDQWRWATLKKGGKTIYRPIPRDRDQAFFKFDGLVMNISNRKWLLRKFQPFREDVRDIAGLNFNARYFDRSFLVEADREDWIGQAKLLQTQITDKVIEEAIRELPKEAFEINGEELIYLLKTRREKLVEFAERYYDVLAKAVDIVGTTDEDYFEVLRLDNGKLEVNVYPRKKGKKVEEERFYHRVFDRKETKEIRLYGLSDNDEYKIKGESRKSVLVRIIAGDKKDKIEDKSRVNGILHKTKIYEVEGKQELEVSKEARVKIKDEGEGLFYDRKAFAYDQLVPIPSMGYNLDDGFFIGPGFSYIKQGFNRKPFKYRHDFYINYAFKAEGYNLKYSNDYIDFIGKYDVGVDFNINQPLVYQFYGSGNETKTDENQIGNSQVRLDNNTLKTRFSRSSKDLSDRITGAIEFQRVEIQEATFADLDLIETQEDFLTFSIDYKFSQVDQEINPSKGLKFNAEISNIQSITTSQSDFFKLKSDLSFFFPVNSFRKQATFAMRGGYAGNFGDFNTVYQSNFLSGIHEVRGLTRNRYAGRAAVYGNVEFRKSFFKIQNYVVPFDLGFLVHGDIGRVWIENGNSERWHNSYGGGLFFNILDFFALVGSYSISDQDQLINVGTNFYF